MARDTKLCACSPIRMVLLVISLWLFLTVSIYFKYFVYSSPSATNNNNAIEMRRLIPNSAQKATNILHGLNEEIDKLQKEKETEAQQAHALTTASKSTTPSPTKKPTSPTTKKPTQKPTFPIYFDTDLSDTTLHSRDWILDRLEYWQKGVQKHETQQSPMPEFDQYMTFWTDCGGFNNIRMAFEYFVEVAYVTKRTLVLPPVEGWYLINYGQLARMKTRERGVTKYGDFFELRDLKLEVPVISAEEFVTRMTAANYDWGLPESIVAAAAKPEGIHGKLIRSYRAFLNKFADEKKLDMPWGPLGSILYWPSIAAVEQSNHKPDTMFTSNRKKVEYLPMHKTAAWLHFPSCDKGDPGTSHDFRYLGQVSTFVWFADTEEDNDLRRVLRDHAHLRNEVFEIASHVIEKLGAFQYASLHIRRNELQYKQSFIAAEQSLSHIKPLLKKDEILYIATDEINSAFFAAIDKQYQAYYWKDFFVNKTSEMYIGDRVSVAREWEGVVEMVICGMARIFFGTDTSTFTAYITRLRGYFGAPDTNTYHHNEQWTGNLQQDSKKYARLWGSTYMDEFPEMWRKIKDTA